MKVWSSLLQDSGPVLNIWPLCFAVCLDASRLLHNFLRHLQHCHLRIHREHRPIPSPSLPISSLVENHLRHRPFELSYASIVLSRDSAHY